MNNIVRFFDQSAVDISDWPKMCYVDYVGLHWFGHSLTAVFGALGTMLGTFFGQ